MVEQRQIPVVCITALPHLARGAGASRVIEGIKIPHPCGRPDLGSEKDFAARVNVLQAAVAALRTAIAVEHDFSVAEVSR
jgi:glycine reductase complex component B subunit gamma